MGKYTKQSPVRKGTSTKTQIVDSLEALNILEEQLKKINNGKYGIGVNDNLAIETGDFLKKFIGESQQQQFLMIRYRLYGGIQSEWDILELKKQDMIAFLVGSLQYIKENGIVIKKPDKTNSPRRKSSNDLSESLSKLHPIVRKTATKLFKNGHYRQAILDTYIALVVAVQEKSNLPDLDNTPLMQKAFSQKSPIIKVSDDTDEQLGFMWLYTGAVMGIRNPKAHHLIEQNDPQRALEWLSFASILLRVLDDSNIA